MNTTKRVAQTFFIVALFSVFATVLSSHSHAAVANKVIIGGSSPFSAGDLVTVEIQAPYPDAVSFDPVEIVLVVDASGSMDSYIQSAKSPLTNFVDDLVTLEGAAKISVVTFSNRPSTGNDPNNPFTKTVFSMRSINDSGDRQDLKNAIQSINPTGHKAYSDLRRGIIYGNSKFSTSNDISRRYLVLVTDGLHNYPASGTSILGETSWNGQCVVTSGGSANISGLRYDEFTVLPGGDTSKDLDFSFNDSSIKHYISPCGYNIGDNIPSGSQFIDQIVNAFPNANRSPNLQSTINKMTQLITPAQVQITDRINSDIFSSIVSIDNPENCSSNNEYGFGDSQKTSGLMFNATALFPSKSGTCVRFRARVKSGVSSGSHDINSIINEVRYENVVGDVLARMGIEDGTISISGNTFPTPEPTSTPIPNPTSTPIPNPTSTPIPTPPPSTKDVGLDPGPHFTVDPGDLHTSTVGVQYFPDSSSWSSGNRLSLEIKGVLKSSQICPTDYRVDEDTSGYGIEAGVQSLGSERRFIYYPTSAQAIQIKPSTSVTPGDYKVCVSVMWVGHVDVYDVEAINFTVAAPPLKDLGLITESGITIDTGTEYDTSIGLQYLPNHSAWTTSDRVNHRSVGIVRSSAACPNDGALRNSGSGPSAGISLTGLYGTDNFDTPTVPFTIQVSESVDPGDYKICLYAFKIRASSSEPWVRVRKEVQFTVTTPPRDLNLIPENNVQITLGKTYNSNVAIEYLPDSSAWDSTDQLQFRIIGVLPSSNSCPTQAGAVISTSGSGITAGIGSLGDGLDTLYFDTSTVPVQILPDAGTTLGDYQICLGLFVSGDADTQVVDAINFEVTHPAWIQIASPIGQPATKVGDVHSNGTVDIDIPIAQFFFNDGAAGVVSVSSTIAMGSNARIVDDQTLTNPWLAAQYPSTIQTRGFDQLVSLARSAQADPNEELGGIPSGNLNSICARGSGAYQINGDFVRNGELNFGDSPQCQAVNIIFFVDGDVVHNANIIDGTNGSTFTIVASGDVTVNPNVTRLDGVHIFGGEFNDSGGDNQLVINGSLIGLAGSNPDDSGGLFDLRRDMQNSNATVPSLLIRYQPKYLYLLKNMLGTASYTWSE